ncbi:hypothetical protein [Chryseolinea sp. H1M3-3]|uniref:hypothetical protein n=1 Tax=Chryseolinea sp. H1M3-3 TaxID=3034144 RepID=UPI0023EAAAE6|nr:hypothetical protein [Chryseolinea sp. H1M3-3]
MEEITKLFTGTLPLFGVFIGWLLTQWGERNKVNREDRRKIKRTIFYLLEVRHGLGFLFTHDAEIAAFIAIFKKKFSRLSDQYDNFNIGELLNKYIKQVASHNPLFNDSDLKNLNSKLNECIDTLAEIDPTLAFRLHGKQNIREALKSIYVQSHPIVGELTNNVSDVEEFKNAFNKIEPNLVNETISDIDYIILELTQKIDRKTAKKIKARLEIFKSPPDLADMESFLNKMFRGVFPEASQEADVK